MRLLITADWQADFDCLDLCEKAAKEVIEIATRERVDAVVFAGDLKHSYNPVDQRVPQFWIDFLERLKAFRRIVVLGNHDRLGMYADANNWLPTLRAIGVSCYDEPSLVPLKSGRLYIAPYSNSPGRTKEAVASMVERVRPDQKNDVLIFHTDLYGAKFNKMGAKSEGGLHPKDLQPHLFAACVGGHIHLQQEIDGAFYCGSPFATAWDEANQQKGYMLVNGRELRYEKSKIPGWYDPSWPGFPKEKTNWKGCRVRIHVKCSDDVHMSQTIDAAEKAAAEKYEGAHISVVPEFENRSEADVAVPLAGTDKEQLEAYVSQTIHPNIEHEKEKILAYLDYQLRKASGRALRQAGGLYFVKARGENFLCFEKIEVSYKKQGLVVVLGENQDWPGRSNGAGKTSYLAPIPVALFGETFKGQTHDSWARWQCTDSAWIELTVRDAKGRELKIIRGRRPSGLQMLIDGKDESSGMGPKETQQQIEQLTGLTWDALANAIYVDQNAAEQFLYGTQKQRKDVLTRFLNLERFERALKLVVAEHKMMEAVKQENRELLAGAEAEFKSCEEFLGRLQVLAKRRVEDASASVEAARDALEDLRKKIAPRRQQLNEELNELCKKEKQYRSEDDAAKKEDNDAWVCFITAEKDCEKLEKLVGKQVCPTCGGSVSKREIETRLRAAERDREKARERGKKIKTRRDETEADIQAIVELKRDKKDALDKIQSDLGDAVDDIRRKEEEFDKQARAATRDKEITDYQIKCAVLARLVVRYREQAVGIDDDLVLLQFCIKAFSRDGLPAFLNTQLCPVLNKAAEEFSEILTGKEIQLRFTVEEGEFIPRVVNAHGGNSLTDQSTGERKMAGLIASFALREIAPPSNVLVMDEPGHGIDAANAKEFVSAILRLKKRFETIFLTTHNPYIATGLSGEKVVTVVKRNSVSSVEVQN